jgi:hypothetical protein
MEKLVAHYSLDAIKAIVAANGVASFTRTALTGWNCWG